MAQLKPAARRADDHWMATEVSGRWTITGDDLQSLLDAGVEAFAVIEADGRIVSWNCVAEAMLGFTREDAVGADLGELLLADDLRAGYRARLDRFVAGGIQRLGAGRIESAAVHRTGRRVPVELDLSMVEIDDRQQIAVLICDVSERERAEASSRRCETIVSASGEAILCEGSDGTIEIWNPAAERLYGYSADEMIGASVARLRPDDGLDDLIRERRPLGNGKSISGETRERRRDGVVIDVMATRSPLCDSDGNVTGVVSVVRDVTEARRNAERLAQAESRFAGAFAAASTGMALTSPDGRFMAVNPALCRFLGRSADTLLASSVQEVTHPDDLAADIEQGQRAMAGQIDSFQQAKRYILPSGGIVWGLLTVSVSRDTDGVAQHYVSQVQDLTDRKTSEGELRRYSAQLEALSEQDPLTGLLNHRAFAAALDNQLHGPGGDSGACSVLLVEVDGDDAVVIAAAATLTGGSRDADVAGYLGHRELAVLLLNVDRRSAAEIVERIAQAIGPAGVRSSHATACSGDNARDLLSRARDELPDAAPQPSGGHAPRVLQGIARLLELARRQLGMPISFLTRLAGDDYVFDRLAGESGRFGVTEGDVMPLAGSYCQRMLDGRIASTACDLAVDPQTRDLELTTSRGLRAYAGVPVRLRSGEIYGTIGGVDTRPHPELSERHVDLLSVLSELAAELIEDETAQRTARRVQAGAAGVRTLLVALQARDFYTSSHSKQVVELASAVARRLGLDPDTTRDVEQVALLHDIGKVGIPDAILQKQGPLDQQEWQLMRQHPIVGEHIIAGTPGLAHLAPAVRAEHESWDGSGYPDGLAGDEIPLASRITLACDALNAMTSDRPYRPAMTLADAQRELQACAGSQFEPRTVAALLAEIATRSQSAAAEPRRGAPERQSLATSSST